MIDLDDYKQGHEGQRGQGARHQNLRAEILRPKEERKCHGQARAREQYQPNDRRHDAGRQMKPGAPRLCDRVDLPEHFNEQRGLSWRGFREAEDSGIERAQRLRGLMALLLTRHPGPFPVNRGLEIIAQGRPCRRHFGIGTGGQPVERFRSPGLMHHRVLRFAELFPHDDDREGREHCIDHANRCEFEAGDLVVRGRTYPAAHQDKRAHGNDRGENHQKQKCRPDRQPGQE